ncbi:hypothetical protein THAOC_23170, partial [Thalassiosira oceanica]
MIWYDWLQEFGLITTLQNEKSRLQRTLTVQQGEHSRVISKHEETIGSLQDHQARDHQVKYSILIRASYADYVSGKPTGEGTIAHLTMQAKGVVNGVQPGEKGLLTYEPDSE